MGEEGENINFDDVVMPPTRTFTSLGLTVSYKETVTKDVENRIKPGKQQQEKSGEIRDSELNKYTKNRYLAS